jgi:hypothetical protein
MTGATDPDGISFTEIGDEIDPVAESAVQASSIQAALSNRILFSYRWPTATEKNAQQNMKEGDTGFQEDTNSSFIYVGLNLGWLPIGYGTGRQLAGKLNVAPTGTAPDFNGSLQVSYPPGYFTATPVVLTSAFSAFPGRVNTSASAVTSAGFQMNLHRTDATTTTTCFWQAIQVS